MSVLALWNVLVMSQNGGGEVWGKFGLNGVKSCNFRQNKRGNALLCNPGMKARDRVYDDVGEEVPFWALEVN